MEHNNRAILILGFFMATGLIFIIRLFMLQVIDPTYKSFAESNTQRKLTEYPARGLIFDRNGKLLVYNQAVYDIMIVPREVKPFDTLAFCQLLGISRDELDMAFVTMRSNMRLRRVSRVKPSVFIQQVPAENFAAFQERLYMFNGFFGQRRTVRRYSFPNASHLLGYVAEVNERVMLEDPFYSLGDYAGITGLENIYETVLRGQKGTRYVMVDVHGREQGAVSDGRMDLPASAGKNLTLFLDNELQAYGEKLMGGRRGAIVALEPSTGGVLAMVSSPGYDPSLLVGRGRALNFPALSADTLAPLLNRAIASAYPPGSTMKMVTALIGLQEQVLTPHSRVSCAGAFHARGLIVGCRSHNSPVNLNQSIAVSCNTFYCNLFRNIVDNPVHGSPNVGLNRWRDYHVNFGFGRPLGSDLFNEGRGFIPNAEYYDRVYNGRWGSITVISLAIGQGEMLTTPLQLANMAAAIANRGYFYTPRAVKEIQNDTLPSRFSERRYTGIDSSHFEPVINGMIE